MRLFPLTISVAAGALRGASRRSTTETSITSTTTSMLDTHTFITAASTPAVASLGAGVMPVPHSLDPRTGSWADSGSGSGTPASSAHDSSAHDSSASAATTPAVASLGAGFMPEPHSLEPRTGSWEDSGSGSGTPASSAHDSSVSAETITPAVASLGAGFMP